MDIAVIPLHRNARRLAELEHRPLGARALLPIGRERRDAAIATADATRADALRAEAVREGGLEISLVEFADRVRGARLTVMDATREECPRSFPD